jgi:hypothetical protein
VGIGQDLPGADHHAGSHAPSLPDADDRAASVLGHPHDLFLDLLERSHGGPS